MLSWTTPLLYIGLIFGVLCIVLGTLPKPRNRRVNLPPPSPLCRRGQTEAVP